MITLHQCVIVLSILDHVNIGGDINDGNKFSSQVQISSYQLNVPNFDVQEDAALWSVDNFEGYSPCFHSPFEAHFQALRLTIIDQSRR